MSVIRRPDVLGRRTQRRLAGLSGAAWAAAAESVAVGTWFALVAVEPRTLFTALAGLGVLVFGALVRTGVVATAVDGSDRLTVARRVLSSITLASAWLCWLLVAEHVGGWAGLAAAGIVLASALSVQFALERRAARLHAVAPLSRFLAVPRWRTALLPALVLAAGSSALLAATWFGDWPTLSIRLPLGWRSIVIDLGGFVIGLLVFGTCSFLAQERRLQRLLAR